VVRTSDFDNAGTFARVFVTFYGVKSQSDKLRLMNEDSNPFQRGKESTFMVFFKFKPTLSFAIFKCSTVLLNHCFCVCFHFAFVNVCICVLTLLETDMRCVLK